MEEGEDGVNLVVRMVKKMKMKLRGFERRERMVKLVNMSK